MPRPGISVRVKKNSNRAREYQADTTVVSIRKDQKTRIEVLNEIRSRFNRDKPMTKESIFLNKRVFFMIKKT